MTNRFRLAVAVVAVISALAGSSAVAADAGGVAVGPHQAFGGLINGRSGAHGAVTIRMACAGPIKPDQTGHPMGGQTVGIFLEASVHGTLGHTGPQTTSIGAFFSAPPPSSRSSGGNVDFTRYGTKPLPTSLTLPCAGSRTVYFVPLPTVPGGQVATVPVRYVGQP